MKMAIKDGQILIKEADSTQFMVIKSWNKMKWSKDQQMLYGPADGELLNKLAVLVKLPQAIEARRRQLNQISTAIDQERIKDNPEPLYRYPVKYKLFTHQMRGANMALIAFGLVPPPEEDEDHDKK
ncbi:MAG: hypothetical protein PHV18_04460 [Lachnospiraceae bacterium]|nr:hypothetical protein [Lachnospiraceae bacterium]